MFILNFFTLMCTDDKFQVEKLVKSGVNINRTDEVDGLAPLHLSAGAGKSLLLYMYFTWPY